MGLCQNYGYHFGGPNNKDCNHNIFGSTLGSPCFGKLPYRYYSGGLERDDPARDPLLSKNQISAAYGAG